jgi:hypothetical protein
VATAGFWGAERVLVQDDGRWSLRRWPDRAELASGLFVASVSPLADWGTTDADWLGPPMYFSGYATEDNLRLVAEAGLTVETARVEQIDEECQPNAFLRIVATRPGSGDER